MEVSAGASQQPAEDLAAAEALYANADDMDRLATMRYFDPELTSREPRSIESVAEELRAARGGAEEAFPAGNHSADHEMEIARELRAIRLEKEYGAGAASSPDVPFLEKAVGGIKDFIEAWVPRDRPKRVDYLKD